MGNVTVDLVDGKRALGGASSYAAAVVAAFGKKACVVTANADDVELGAVFEVSHLYCWSHQKIVDVVAGW